MDIVDFENIMAVVERNISDYKKIQDISEELKVLDKQKKL